MARYNLKFLFSSIKNYFGLLKESFKRPELQKHSFKARDIAFFFKFVKPVWKIAAISFTLTIFLALIKSIIPLSTKVFVDFVIRKQAQDQVYSILLSLGLQSATPRVVQALQTVEYVILLMIIFGITYVFLEAIINFTRTIYEQELTYNLQTALFDQVLRFPLSFLKSKQTGYLVSRVSGDVFVLQFLMSNMITSVISNFFFLLFSLLVLSTLNLTVALIVACTIPAYIAINYFFSRRIRAVRHSEQESFSQLQKNMQEVLSGVEIVKSHVTEEKEVEKVSIKMRTLIQTRIRSMIVTSASSLMIRGIQYAGLLVVMWFGAKEIERGTMTIGDYIAFLSYMILLSGSVSNIFSTYLNLQPVLASLDRMMELFKVDTEYESDEKSRKGLTPMKVIGNIKYANVTFSYEVDKPVLNNIDFDIKPGETIALIGLSGVGKTTLVNLLLKFYMPQTGAIYLDGNNLQDLNTAWLRKQIGFVSQDIFLFDDSIENNIKYGSPAASKEEVVEAAKMAHIHDAIMQFPNGYNTVVGERGVKLSTGQRQRVSIARTYLKNPPLLILDEPTSALDMETEKHLKESLKTLVKDRTTIIISHRMILTDIADKVLVISEGGVTYWGTYKDLKAKEGLYQSLITVERDN